MKKRFTVSFRDFPLHFHNESFEGKKISITRTSHIYGELLQIRGVRPLYRWSCFTNHPFENCLPTILKDQIYLKHPSKTINDTQERGRLLIAQCAPLRVCLCLALFRAYYY